MLRLIQNFTKLGAYLLLGTSTFLLGITIWAFLNASLSFNNYLTLGLLLGFNLAVIASSFIGICGIRNKKGIYLLIFQVFVLIFALAFVGLGVVSFVMPEQIFNGSCDNSENQLVMTAFKANGLSKDFCNQGCSCNLENQTIINGNYTIQEKNSLFMYTRQQTGPIRYQDCTAAQSLNQTYQNMFIILQSIENLLDCSGWCSNDKSLIYRFSDVNNGRPKITCYETMKDKIFTYSHIIGISSFSIAFFLFLVCFCGLCICCSKQNRQRPFRNRFILNESSYYEAI